MAREAITQYNNPTPVSPDDCYALNVETRENGDYLVHVSQRPDKTCEIIDYGRPSQPFDIEVNGARGSAFVVGYPGVQAKPRDLAVFPLTDAPALHSPDPQDIRNWRLEGDATHLAYTKQCHLSLAEIPFEMRNGYFFGLTATTESRLLRVSYNVNSVYPVVLKNDTRADFVFVKGDAPLASYRAAVKAGISNHSQQCSTTNDVYFEADMNEKAAFAFLETLGRTTEMQLRIDSKPDGGGLGLYFGNSEHASDQRNVNDMMARAFKQCLDVIWN